FHEFHQVSAAEPFQGMGIRIEDNLLITEQGAENLTVSLPRTPEQIEEACAVAPLKFLQT
ncbi:MAG: hypothetical protein AAGJ35_14030, partial [Myxococcota bacterium]